MDNLTPPLLELIRELRFGLRAGLSLRESLSRGLFLGASEFTAKLQELWELKAHGQKSGPRPRFKSHHTEVFWDLLERADQGQPIDEPLEHLFNEVERVAASDLERHISLLPFKALVPLLIFQLPAFAVLLIGPLLREMQKHLLIAPLFLLSLYVQAEPLNSAFVERLTRAKSAKVVKETRDQFSRIETLRKACRMQLVEQNVPYSCYEVLNVERAAGLRDTTARQITTRARLDRRCAVATIEFRGLNGGSDRHLSPACKFAVERARQLLIYRSEEAELGSSFEL